MLYIKFYFRFELYKRYEKMSIPDYELLEDFLRMAFFEINTFS